MPYRRPTKGKAEAQKAARKLYVNIGLSLKEVHQQTGETLRTLRSWRTIGDWDGLREEKEKTELDRLERLRDGLLDRAEAQSKEGNMPQAEIRLMCKLENLIAQQKKEETMVKVVALNTVGYFMEYMVKQDQNLAVALAPHFEEWAAWVGSQDFDISARDFRRRRKIEIPIV